MSIYKVNSENQRMSGKAKILLRLQVFLLTMISIGLIAAYVILSNQMQSAWNSAATATSIHLTITANRPDGP